MNAKADASWNGPAPGVVEVPKRPRVASKVIPQGFTVVYRKGGTSFCEWIRVLELYHDEADAKAKAAELERMGYRAVVHPWNFIVAIGLPIGWCPTSVDWEIDHVHIVRDHDGVMLRTYWGAGRAREPGSVGIETLPK